MLQTRFKRAFILIGVVILGPFKFSAQAENRSGWEPLPATGFVVGHSATRSDINSGSAIFVLEEDGVPMGHPLQMQIPQYGYHIDAQSKKRTPCIVVQAESFRGVNLVGFREVGTHREAVDVDENFQFLGCSEPQASSTKGRR